MKSYQIAIQALLLASSLLGLGCSAGDGAGDDAPLGESAEALWGPPTLGTCSIQRFGAVGHAPNDSDHEYAWHVDAPKGATYDYEAEGSELSFVASTAGEYRVVLTECTTRGSDAGRCSSVEYPISVTEAEVATSDAPSDEVDSEEPADSCTPHCSNRQCGPDGCGGLCGTCSDGQQCNEDTGQCEAPCEPDCSGRSCGTDGCGGLCGTCSDGQECTPDGQCMPIQHSGRVVTLLMALSDWRLSVTDPFFRDRAHLMVDAVSWVSPKRNPKVLLVRDDSCHGLACHENHMIGAVLKAHGLSVTYRNEPADGLDAQQLTDYQVVWFSNPTQAVDDEKSIQALTDFVRNGGGLVLQGDDLTQNPNLKPLTGLQYVGDGNYYCGQRMGGRFGASYEVDVQEVDHPVIGRIKGETFFYGEDIDSSTLLPGANVTVLAWAGLPHHRVHACYRGHCQRHPVVVAMDRNQP
jgi:hypothetical protein